MKRLIRLVLVLGAFGAVFAVLRRRPAPPSASPTAPPTPPRPVAAPTLSPEPAPARRPTWFEPTAAGGCPDGYPVKAKLASGIFHVPGGGSYDRTRPDRCYASPEAAEADGLRPAKR